MQSRRGLTQRDGLDTAALTQYLGEFRRALRATRDPKPQPGDAVVEPDWVRWRRMAASHAARRLPVGSYAEAAGGGLQDSAPRAAQLQLHARTREVAPDAWEHPTLAQIWLRWADYVIPRADLALFTLGAMPRNVRHTAALDALADLVVETIQAEGGDSNAVRTRLDGLPIRSAAVTGRLLIRWDARTIEIRTEPAPKVDHEIARLGLARRFLHWYGPATPAHLSKFAGIPRADAEETFRAIAGELAPVSFEDGRRWLLLSDMQGLDKTERPTGVRFLTMGDPVTYMNDTDPRPPARLAIDKTTNVTARLVNSLTNRLVVDGRVLGAWGRVRGDVTIDPWCALDRRARTEIEEEAAGVAAAVGSPLRIRWLDRGH